MDQLKEGSYTVEITGIMGILLLAVVLVIYLDLNIQDQSELKISGYEMAVTAVLEDYDIRNTGKTEKQWEIRNWSMAALEGVWHEITGNERQYIVNSYGKTTLQIPGMDPFVQKECLLRKTDPVKLIRSIRMVREWKEMVN